LAVEISSLSHRSEIEHYAWKASLFIFFYFHLMVDNAYMFVYMGVGKVGWQNEIANGGRV
jgi:hypothetical protein